VQNKPVYSSQFTVTFSHHMGAVDEGAVTSGEGRGLMPFFFMNSVTWSGISASTSLARYAWLTDMLLP